ncbi:aldose epimerase family protein [Flavobacterium algicola]|uniref:aldose epimerase family protein n=1 Tax=Flavobacterium algicola TaxID=556529 RepID=UPI001EFC3234|nr:aldose epimerase family protein [Flavobacterium algicola]MCG9792050.1 galactose mutarotase [Flavobacterium algicola]
MSIEKSKYGTTPNGDQVDSYKLKNHTGMEVDIITFGGIITAIKVPNIAGTAENVVIGFNNLEQYMQPNPYFGALIGRYGNRIANAKFSIDDIEYKLAANNGPNNLHGGPKGFHKIMWTVEATNDGENSSIKLKYISKDMEEGFPGNLTVYVTYTLQVDNTLEIVYEAITDKSTVINLTQHTYFNLSADFSKTILDHEIVIDADQFVPIDAFSIPTGKLQNVVNTPFDFRQSKIVGKEIDENHEQLTNGKGYDHCWVLNNQDQGFRFAASAYDKLSGRFLEVKTTEPGVQFYTGNFIDGTLPTRDGEKYARRTGFCLETQHYPDSPNQESFPTTLLREGEKYESKTSFTFSIK